MEWIEKNLGALVAIAAAIHTLAVLIVNLTPTPKDDAVVARIYKFVETLAGLITKRVKDNGRTDLHSTAGQRGKESQ